MAHCVFNQSMLFSEVDRNCILLVVDFVDLRHHALSLKAFQRSWAAGLHQPLCLIQLGFRFTVNDDESAALFDFVLVESLNFATKQALHINLSSLFVFCI